MTCKMRGKLYECAGMDVHNRLFFQPSIVDALNEAKKTLKDVKTLDGLSEWAMYWFGDE